MSISRNVERSIIATPRFVAIHLGCEVEEEFLPQGFRATCARYYRAIKASVDDLGEVDVVWLPIDQRDAPRGEICFGNSASPIIVPRVVSKVDGRCLSEFGRGLGYITAP